MRVLVRPSCGRRVFGFHCVALRLLLVLAAPWGHQAVAQPLPGPSLEGRRPSADGTPFERWRWAFQQRVFPMGSIPDGAITRALDQIAGTGAAAGPAVPGSRWVNIGPAPIAGGQIGAEGHTRPMSGRVAAADVDPGDPNHWLIGAAEGGVWETRDAGQTWVPRTDDAASLATGAIAFAPSAPNVVYAGTGEGIGTYAGAGLLKSLDGGETWRLFAQGTFSGATVRRIRVHPTDHNIFLVASRGGFGAQPKRQAQTGIFKSMDGGVTWSHGLRGRGSALEVSALDFARQYAAIGVLGGTQPDPTPIPNEPTPVPNGVYRSFDGGDEWSVVPGPWDSESGGVGRIELALAPSDPNVLYVSIADAEDDRGDDGTLMGLWRTTNAWDAVPGWEHIDLNGFDYGFRRYGYCGWDAAFGTIQRHCDYSHAIIVDPTNPSVLFAGGVQLYRLEGRRWTAEVSHTVSDPHNGIHVDQHHMVWTGGRLIVANDGGVWSTTDGGATWQDHNTTLAITQFYAGSLHPTDPFFAVAGSQDNGTEKWTGAEEWRWVNFGDGGPSAISDTNPSLSWAVSSQYLRIERTQDGGASFHRGDDGIDDNWRVDADRRTAPFIARFEKCPNNEDVFIAGTDNVWKTTEFFRGGDPQWRANSMDLKGDDGTPVSISALAFAAAAGGCDTYALGTEDGRLMSTSDGGLHWVDLDPAGMVPGRYVSDLAFDPTDANILYAALSGFDAGTPGQPGHLFQSTNALSDSPTWTNIGPPVDLPHNAVAVDPLDPRTLYVATDLAVWKTSDGGADWVPMGPRTGMPNVVVSDLQISGATDRIAAFTYGRGAFVLEVAADTPTPTPTPTPTQTPRPTFTLGPCVGDCSHNGVVTIDELVKGVTIATGATPTGTCPSFDTNADENVMVDELIRAVNSALYGCVLAAARPPLSL